jgi:acyl-CoA thioester hydrolase
MQNENVPTNGKAHACTLRVRTYECDSYGHVNNANYLNYLEYARYEFLRSVGFDYQGFIDAGFAVYIAKIEIEYKSSSLTDDELTITTWPLKKGAVSGTLAQRISRKEADGSETLISDAKVTWACVNARTRKLVRLPAQWDLEGLAP